MHQTFERKLCHKNGMLEKHSIAHYPQQTNGKASSNNAVYRRVDEDARSFCDSVSSIACSNFAKEKTEQNAHRDYHNKSVQIAKFNTIEKWLQSLPTPAV